MGNYMSSDPPTTPWSILHAEVIKLGEDFEVELGGMGMSAINFRRCTKNPGHSNMIPVDEFSINHLPPAWRKNWVFDVLRLSAQRVVKINVPYTSEDRPDTYFLGKYKGQKIGSVGTGLAEIGENLLAQAPIDCRLKNCPVPRPHKVTAVFKVVTAKHVVYDDSEAELTTLEFFFDNPRATVVKADVIKSDCSSKLYDSCALFCVSHDLDLFNKVFSISRPRPIKEPIHKTPPRPLVAIISHPHGYFKHVSIGEWVGYNKPSFNVDKIGSLSVREMFAQIERESPNWETTGHSFNNERMSPEFLRLMQQRLRENPDMRFSQWFQNADLKAAFPFMTYTAATCPGSSGARVLVFYSRPDGSCCMGMTAGHFRCARKARDTHLHQRERLGGYTCLL